MTLRSVPLLIVAFSSAPLAQADELPPVSEPLQIAQATPGTAPAATATVAPRAVHGTLRGVLAAADRGPDALRRYIEITQTIYGYRFEDFARPEWYR